MYEDRPERDTPETVREELAAYGGLSPDGQPIWRLVLAENCRIRCFGQRNHKPDGLRLDELPDSEWAVDKVVGRLEVGEFWVPRYHERGWILQRWFPAHVWGLRSAWENERDRDGRTRLLAAWPARGDYMMMPCGPWKSIAAAGDLKAAIRCYNMQQRRNPVRWDNHMAAMLALEQQERQQEADAYAAEMAAQHRLGVGSALRSATANAQAVRDQVSRATAGGVMLGASEKWG